MIALIRLAVFGFIFLAIIYLLVSVYSRSVRREKLEKSWDEDIKEGDRDAYVEKGMKEYESSLRRKLIVLVFVIPILLVSGLIYVTNFM